MLLRGSNGKQQLTCVHKCHLAQSGELCCLVRHAMTARRVSTHSPGQQRSQSYDGIGVRGLLGIGDMCRQPFAALDNTRPGSPSRGSLIWLTCQERTMHRQSLHLLVCHRVSQVGRQKASDPCCKWCRCLSQRNLWHRLHLWPPCVSGCFQGFNTFPSCQKAPRPQVSGASFRASSVAWPGQQSQLIASTATL